MSHHGARLKTQGAREENLKFEISNYFFLSPEHVPCSLRHKYKSAITKTFEIDIIKDSHCFFTRKPIDILHRSLMI
jgi:hypothetical protein